MTEILEQLDLRSLYLIIALLFGDILLGAALAWREERFNMQRLGDALKDKGIPTFVVLIFAAILRFLSIDTAWETWADGAYIAITGALTLPLLGSILLNLKDNFNIDLGAPPSGLPSGKTLVSSPIEEEYDPYKDENRRVVFREDEY